MKRQAAISVLVVSFVCAGASTASAQLGALKGLAKKATDKATEKKPDPAPDPQPAATDPKPTDPAADTPAAPATSTTAGAATPAADAGGEPNYKVYQNYDFVPGEKIVFDDDFRSDDDGEFPAHWKLVRGQAVVNKLNGAPVFALTEGNYVSVTPRMTTASYLADPFTIEFDYYPKTGSYARVIVFLMARARPLQASGSK